MNRCATTGLDKEGCQHHEGGKYEHGDENAISWCFAVVKTEEHCSGSDTQVLPIDIPIDSAFDFVPILA